MLLSAAAFSAAYADEISLPAVTTVISGQTLTAGKEAVPDFNNVLPGPETAAAPIPELPAEKTDVPQPSETAVQKQDAEKDIYAEGLVGGGYPGYFTGNFSLYRSKGENPFLLKFAHESASGYAGKAFTDGYFDAQTDVFGKKTLTAGSTVWNFTGSYNNAENGFQSVSSAFYDMTKQTLAGGFSADTACTENFMLYTAVSGDWYNRYGGKAQDITVPDAQKNVSMLSFDPSVKGEWTLNSVKIGLEAKYNLENSTGSNSSISGYGSDLTDKATHRGLFGLDISWSNDTFTVFEKAGLVAGTAVGGNSVILPFSVGASVKCVTPLSPREMSLSAEGGLSSEQRTYKDLERAFKFTYLSFIPGETTDWYGIFKASVPVADRFTVAENVEYRKTAFDNGVWEPDYDHIAVSGLYAFVQNDQTIMKTVSSLSADTGIMTATVDWTSYWIDVPVLENKQTVGVSAAVQDKTASKGVEATARFEIGSDADTVPEIGASCFTRVSKAVRIAVKADDIVKLLTGDTRTYAGKYVTRSGYAAVLVKFFF